MAEKRPVVLSIAGSDSGGGAGIQADIRAISASGGFATTAITALTAQNLNEVRSVHGVDVAFLASQVQAVWEGFNVRAVKTGMLWSKEIVEFVALWAEKNTDIPFVVDPVMLSTSGGKLLSEDAIESYRESLLPNCHLATPNLDECSFLLGEKVENASELNDAAFAFAKKFHCSVLLKGGHLGGDPLDVLVWKGEVYSWKHPRIEGVETHGSGCTLSSLVATELAKGKPLNLACEAAILFLQKIFQSPIELENGPLVLGHEEALP